MRAPLSQTSDRYRFRVFTGKNVRKSDLAFDSTRRKSYSLTLDFRGRFIDLFRIFADTHLTTRTRNGSS